MPFQIVRNDITRMQVDAIVNAANSSLLGGGGVDGAIHAAAGPELRAECATLGGCDVGEAKITAAYRLPAKYVIHTVGPIWRGGGNGERELLTACYRNALALAEANGCETVAFPLISAGAYGYPESQAVAVAEETIRAYLMEHDLTVYLVLYGPTELPTRSRVLLEVLRYIGWARQAAAGAMPAPMAPPPAGTEDRPRRKREAEQAIRVEEAAREKARRQVYAAADEAMATPLMAAVEELLKRTDEGFSAALLRLIDERGMTDAQAYRRANVDRRLFSKIRSNPDYRPSKSTVFAFAVALRLTLPETEDLLRKAGFAFSDASKSDLVVKFFLERHLWDIDEINEVLYQFDLPLLGSL
ncbi:MAG: O-acetyl-ADP-ribose deacetylase [Clostridia bacterium]|nr:O-acetyl-ADP-ribose deacetylase [Clostridia bacterium]